MTVDIDTSIESPADNGDSHPPGGEPAGSDEDTSVESPAADAPCRRPGLIGRADLRVGFAFGVIALVALAAISGWLGWRTYQSHRDLEQSTLFVETATRVATNLTTIRHSSADQDVTRIVGSLTGSFHDDFQNRSLPFIEAIKQAQTDTVGTVTAAALESAREGRGQVLVAVSVATSNAGAPEEQPRLWRMRIDVEDTGADVKVSNVEFVP